MTLDSPALSLLREPPIAWLYQQIAPRLFDHIRKRVSSDEDAEDILVEVFVAALEQEGFFAWASQEQQAWLWRVARNKTVDLYRRHTRHQSVPLRLDDELAFEQESGNPEQLTLLQETATQLHRFIERLSPVQQQVLQLRFSADLRCSQIAATLGKREGTIRSILARTLNQLRRQYAQHSEGRETAR